MQPSQTIRSNAVGVLLVAAALAGAQAPLSAPGKTPPDRPHVFSAPTNLRVLPKDFTGLQVHDLMKQWAGSLGARCSACHLEVTESAAPNGKPHLDFADDSKSMKAVARLMYTMTQAINNNYIAKLNGSGVPVTCGTCHRGVVNPALFTLPPGRGIHPVQATPVTPERQQTK